MKKNLSVTRMFSLLFFSLLFLLANPIPAYAQKQKVTGTVYDERQEPMVGVTVMVEGTTTGTVTDMNGTFSVDVQQDASRVKFSFFGLPVTDIECVGP